MFQEARIDLDEVHEIASSKPYVYELREIDDDLKFLIYPPEPDESFLRTLNIIAIKGIFARTIDGYFNDVSPFYFNRAHVDKQRYLVYRLYTAEERRFFCILYFWISRTRCLVKNPFSAMYRRIAEQKFYPGIDFVLPQVKNEQQSEPKPDSVQIDVFLKNKIEDPNLQDPLPHVIAVLLSHPFIRKNLALIKRLLEVTDKFFTVKDIEKAFEILGDTKLLDEWNSLINS